MGNPPRPVGLTATLLILGRVSNLPTVWSNCLAAWLLAGGGASWRVGWVCLGATLLYTGGMFLNDAFDEEFDRQHRPERPIPSGQVQRRAVWLLGGLWLALGWLCFPALGNGPALWASLLAATIIFYDAVHKHTGLAPVLMCGCRFLLYLVAASAATSGPGAPVLWRAGALAGYVAGLSFWARGSAAAWPALLLLCPLAVSLWVGSWGMTTLVPWLVLAGWMVWCLRGAYRKDRRDFGRGVAGLLAGIVLVDWLAAAGTGLVTLATFPGLFALALLLQRVAPAT